MKRFLILGIVRPLVLILFLPIFLLSFLYLHTNIYDFPEEKPFSGDHWYNPYQDIDSGTTQLKGNFHAHTIAWGGLTNGHDTEEELIEGYENHDYDIIGISNYHKNSEASKKKDGLFFPIYEHGYNIYKCHKQVFGGKEEIYLDYPIVQLLSHKQDIIYRLKEDSKAIAINHPVNRNGHTKDDLTKMVGYDFIEVLSNSGQSVEHWDAALSAGRLAWILANDDTHGISDLDDTFNKWTYIFSEGKSKDQVLEAMKVGKMYGVNSVVHGCKTKLEYCRLSGDTLKVKFDQPQKSLVFVSEGGKELGVFYGTEEASLVIPADAPYVRVYGYNPDCYILLNPVVRWDGENLPLAANMEAPVNWPLTFLAKFIVLLMLIIEGYIIYKISRWLGRVARA